MIIVPCSVRDAIFSFDRKNTRKNSVDNVSLYGYAGFQFPVLSGEAALVLFQTVFQAVAQMRR